VHLEQQPSSGAQRPGEGGQHRVVGVRVEVAERGEPVDDRIEFGLVLERADVESLERHIRIPLPGEGDEHVTID
jgi:hypothetical protein